MGIFVRERAVSAVALGGAVAVTLGLVSVAPDARGMADIQQVEIGAVRLQAEVVALIENAPSDVVSVLTETIDAVVTSAPEDAMPLDESPVTNPVDEATPSTPDYSDWSGNSNPVNEVEPTPVVYGSTGSAVSGFDVLSQLMMILAIPLAVLFSPILLPLVFIVGPILGAVSNAFTRSSCMYCGIAASVESPAALPEGSQSVASAETQDGAVSAAADTAATSPEPAAESAAAATSPQRRAVRTNLRTAASRGNLRVVPASSESTAASASANPSAAALEGPSRSMASRAAASRADRTAAAQVTRGR